MNITHELTNLDILEQLQEAMNSNYSKNTSSEKDEYAMLEENYLSYAE